MMKTLKRWTTSIAGSFDWLITQVENHEALVNSALREVQETQARAGVRLGRVKADGAAMRKRIEELNSSRQQWQERAIKTAALDEKRALECLRRKIKLEKRIAELEEQEREHARIEKQLSQDLSLIDERAQQLKRQRNLMRTRQSRAEALCAVQGADTGVLGEIDEIFERWEARVAECEIYAHSPGRAEDELEEEFASQEEEQALKQALQELVLGNAAGTQGPAGN